MNEYKIEAWEEMGGYITIKANSLDEAKEKAIDHIGNYGMNTHGDIDVDVTHRDVHTQ